MIAFEQSVAPDAAASGATAKVQVTTTIYVDLAPVIREVKPIGGHVQVDTDKSLTSVFLNLQGTGTAHYRGNASFKITEGQNKEPIATGTLEPLVVLPGTTAQFAGKSDVALHPGEYSLDVSINSDEPDVPTLRKVYEFSVL
jgi:hypothetical protein